MGSRAKLAVMTMIVLAWAAWLGWQVFTTADPIVISRPQVLVSPVVVEAKLEAKGDGPAAGVELTHIYRPKGRYQPGETISIQNLAECAGWAGTGEYILTMQALKVGEEARFRVTATPPSPGFNPNAVDGAGQPRIYPVTPSTRAQLSDALGP